MKQQTRNSKFPSTIRREPILVATPFVEPYHCRTNKRKKFEVSHQKKKTELISFLSVLFYIRKQIFRIVLAKPRMFLLLTATAQKKYDMNETSEVNICNNKFAKNKNTQSKRKIHRKYLFNFVLCFCFPSVSAFSSVYVLFFSSVSYTFSFNTSLHINMPSKFQPYAQCIETVSFSFMVLWILSFARWKMQFIQRMFASTCVQFHDSLHCYIAFECGMCMCVYVCPLDLLEAIQTVIKKIKIFV